MRTKYTVNRVTVNPCAQSRGAKPGTFCAISTHRILFAHPSEGRARRHQPDNRNMKPLLYRIAAFFLRADVYQFEGRRRNGEWVKGFCILSPEAYKAHVAAFRAGASVYSDTALTGGREKVGRQIQNIIAA